ncbi:MAG: LysR substrate-binding domain-containing protein [Betaproteobacteria bacterium]|nr:transcriptional regulator [Betaproteobacteria bacterium UKL13-2]HCG52736.1 DNA-binding transcriptional regulator OxyR [Betaproteobacteria bacterium]
MNLRDLRYLVALADHRHFGRAAEASHVSQPTLSTQLKKFEDELGVSLVERNPRNVMLTSVGEAVLARARVMLREADEIRAIARRSKDPESGLLKLGIFPTLGPYLLPHVIPGIIARYPKLELILVEEKTEVILRKLNDGELDCGILALPLPDDNLQVEFLFEEDFILAVPKQHPMAKQKKVSLSDLAQESLLLLDDGHCLRAQALEVCHMAGAGERPGFRATSLETLRHMVAANAGITLLPALTVHSPSPVSPSIKLIPFNDPIPHRRIAMAWRRTSALNDFLHGLVPLLRRFPTMLLHAPKATK